MTFEPLAFNNNCQLVQEARPTSICYIMSSQILFNLYAYVITLFQFLAVSKHTNTIAMDESRTGRQNRKVEQALLVRTETSGSLDQMRNRCHRDLSGAMALPRYRQTGELQPLVTCYYDKHGLSIKLWPSSSSSSSSSLKHKPVVLRVLSPVSTTRVDVNTARQLGQWKRAPVNAARVVG